MEGGVLWEYLLSKAIPHFQALPDPTNVCGWTTKDIEKLPAKDQQAWCKAQFEELEAFKKCNVYSLLIYPPAIRLSKITGYLI